MKKSTLLLFLFFPFLLASTHGQDGTEAPADLTKMGEGDYRFDWVPGWGTLDDEDLKPTNGDIAVSADGHVYCSMDSDRSIMIFSADGEVVRNFDAKFKGLHGVCIHKEGDEEFLYAAGRARVVKFKLDGTVVWEMNGAPKSDDFEIKRYNLTGIAVLPNGDFYLADGYGSNWIYHFNKDREFVRRFGGPGSKPGQFRTAHNIDIDTRGETPRLLICDRDNNRMQYFTLDGEFIRVFAEGLRRPCAASFHGDHVAIAELNSRVTILNGKDEQVQHLGDNDKKFWSKYKTDKPDWVDGLFITPHGISYDNDGNLIVMDWNFRGRINKLEKVK